MPAAARTLFFCATPDIGALVRKGPYTAMLSMAVILLTEREDWEAPSPRLTSRDERVQRQPTPVPSSVLLVALHTGHISILLPL